MIYLKSSLLLMLLITFSACSRSPLEGAGNANCESGDRVILNERLFCVFEESRVSRPIELTEEQVSGAETEITAGTSQDEEQGGDMASAGVMSIRTAESYCPSSAPVAHRYETLTICGEEAVNITFVEAVVAEWSAEYADEPIVEVDMQVAGAESTAGDNESTEPDSIGVLIDYGVPEGD